MVRAAPPEIINFKSNQKSDIVILRRTAHPFLNLLKPFFEEPMAESPETREGKPPGAKPESRDPGLLESYGSFPVWLLKLIQLMTPSFLISKTPPKKKDYRI